jgi:hypothetical protein
LNDFQPGQHGFGSLMQKSVLSTVTRQVFPTLLQNLFSHCI